MTLALKTLPLKLLFFLIIANFSKVNAQFNDSTFYHFNVASTGVYNKTNIASSYLFNNVVKFSISKNNIVFNSQNAWMYGKNKEILSNNDFSSSLDFNLYKTLKNFYYWGMGNYDKSFSLKINHRLQAGLGIGYNIVNKKHFVVILSDGVLIENGNLFDKQDQEWKSYAVFRNSFKLKYKISIKDKVFIDGSNYLQNSLSDVEDYIVRFNTNLSVKLLKWLSFTTTFNYNKVSATQKENILWTFGLGIDKYF